MNASEPLRLRPSVSAIPTTDPTIWEFFQGNTRRIIRVKLANPRAIDPILALNGFSLNHLRLLDEGATLSKLAQFLFEKCCIEYVGTGKEIEKSSRYRVLQFLADYFPSNEILTTFSKIQNSRVAIVGAGAVGSWVATGLVQTGVRKLVLIDPDLVEKSNLNRSHYTQSDIGLPKAQQLASQLLAVDSDIEAVALEAPITSERDLEELAEPFGHDFQLVINCADSPSVDAIARLIANYCFPRTIPHIIAGGYNLHLSLIGPTIVPSEGACFECIQTALESDRPAEFDGVSKLERKRRNIGNTSPVNAISSSFVVNEAIRALCRSKRLMPHMIGRRGEFNYLTSEINFTEYLRLKGCSCCGQR